MAGPPLRIADSSQENEKSYVLSTVCAPRIFGLIEAEHHISAENTYPRTCWFQHVLGFTHVCGTDRRGTFAVIRLPSQKSRRKFLARTKEWLSRHRHWKRRDQQRQLTTMLRGFYQYFGLHHCQPKLDDIRREVQLQWIRVLRRRSQRHRLYWCYLLSRSWFELPYAETRHATV